MKKLLVVYCTLVLSCLLLISCGCNSDTLENHEFYVSKLLVETRRLECELLKTRTLLTEEELKKLAEKTQKSYKDLTQHCDCVRERGDTLPLDYKTYLLEIRRFSLKQVELLQTPKVMKIPPCMCYTSQEIIKTKRVFQDSLKTLDSLRVLSFKDTTKTFSDVQLETFNRVHNQVKFLSECFPD